MSALFPTACSFGHTLEPVAAFAGTMRTKGAGGNAGASRASPRGEAIGKETPSSGHVSRPPSPPVIYELKNFRIDELRDGLNSVRIPSIRKSENS